MEVELYQKVKDAVQSILGIDLTHYKDEQMRRRLDSWLSRVGATNWDVYFERIRKEPTELARFRDYLTINVTEFFRDPERWLYLRQNILPELIQDAIAARRPELHIWSAGCSTGAEPFTLSIIMDELTPGKGHYILGTDLDRGALAKARIGGPFVAEEVRNLNPTQRSNYLKPGGPPFSPTDALINKVKFRELNLLQDDYEKNFDLIVCRNVVIYFTAETKQMLYKKFYDALRVGGVLFVGGTEIIPRPQDVGFRGSGFSFYVKT